MYFKNQSLILMLKKDFESQNFAIFEKIVHNFGRYDDDIVISKRCFCGLMPF